MTTIIWNPQLVRSPWQLNYKKKDPWKPMVPKGGPGYPSRCGKNADYCFAVLFFALRVTTRDR
jgi:hypothetical protein